MGSSGTAAEQMEIPDAVLEQAAQWYALLRSGESSEADRCQWQTWLQAHAHHQLAWQRVERIGQRFAPIQSSPNRDAAVHTLQTLNRTGMKRRDLLLGLAAIAGTGALSYGVVRHSPLPAMLQARRADHSTGTGELRDVRLADGSRIWLNAGTALDQEFTVGQRRLQLHAGEAFIEAADDLRPLIVHTDHGTVKAFGTRFNVRVDGGETLAGVYAGAVRVRHGSSDAEQVLQAGEQMRFTHQALHAPTAADLAREAWTRGVILAQDIPLAELVRELRRYRRGMLEVADEVAQLRVFGSFPANDPDAALALLAQALPIEVRRRWGWWVVIEGRAE